MMALRLTREQREQALEWLNYFKIDGVPADEVATEGQILLFASLVLELAPRIHIMTCTQYGKSLFVALACIVLSCMENEMITVAAPTDEKAAIIMRYYIEHVGDNIAFWQKLDKQTKLDRLKQETTKDKIILREDKETGKAGGIFVISVQGGNSQKGFEAAMGQGSRKVILDEAALIPDENEATAFRMIAGKGRDSLYVKIGNPFYKEPPRSHFFKSYRDPAYLKIDIDYQQALLEGRYTQEFIDEAKQKPLFPVLYENKFPSSKTQDQMGFIQLISQATLDNAYLPDDIDLDFIGERVMGIDLAGGGRDFSTIVVRGDNIAKLMWRHQTEDPLIVITKAVEIAQKLGIPIDDRSIFPDKTGAIAWCARMNEMYPYGKDEHPNAFGVMVGGSPEVEDNEEHKKYLNKRAQISVRTAAWVNAGGKLVGKPYFDEALEIRYKMQTDKKIQIMSKEIMRKRGIPSPDVWDALALTFTRTQTKKGRGYKQGDYTPTTNFGI
jgi:hypothetical protein